MSRWRWYSAATESWHPRVLAEYELVHQLEAATLRPRERTSVQASCVRGRGGEQQNGSQHDRSEEFRSFQLLASTESAPHSFILLRSMAASFCDLPAELLLLIFEYTSLASLPHLRAVQRSWHAVILEHQEHLALAFLVRQPWQATVPVACLCSWLGEFSLLPIATRVLRQHIRATTRAARILPNDNDGRHAFMSALLHTLHVRLLPLQTTTACQGFVDHSYLMTRLQLVRKHYVQLYALLEPAAMLSVLDEREPPRDLAFEVHLDVKGKILRAAHQRTELRCSLLASLRSLEPSDVRDHLLARLTRSASASSIALAADGTSIMEIVSETALLVTRHGYASRRVPDGHYGPLAAVPSRTSGSRFDGPSYRNAAAAQAHEAALRNLTCQIELHVARLCASLAVEPRRCDAAFVARCQRHSLGGTLPREQRQRQRRAGGCSNAAQLERLLRQCVRQSCQPLFPRPPDVHLESLPPADDDDENAPYSTPPPAWPADTLSMRPRCWPLEVLHAAWWLVPQAADRLAELLR